MKKEYIVLCESTTDGWTGLVSHTAENFHEVIEKIEMDGLYNVVNIIEGGKIVW